MTGPDPKGDLLGYLQAGREAVLWRLEGLSEYDVRRPLTPTGTNLLGLVKHLGGVEPGYFGETFGQPSAGRRPGNPNMAPGDRSWWGATGAGWSRRPGRPAAESAPRPEEPRCGRSSR